MDPIEDLVVLCDPLVSSEYLQQYDYIQMKDIKGLFKNVAFESIRREEITLPRFIQDMENYSKGLNYTFKDLLYLALNCSKSFVLNVDSVSALEPHYPIFRDIDIRLLSSQEALRLPPFQI